MPNKNNWLSFILSKKNRDLIYEINKQINNRFESLDVMDYNPIHMTSVFLENHYKVKIKIY